MDDEYLTDFYATSCQFHRTFQVITNKDIGMVHNLLFASYLNR